MRSGHCRTELLQRANTRKKSRGKERAKDRRPNPDFKAVRMARCHTRHIDCFDRDPACLLVQFWQRILVGQSTASGKRICCALRLCTDDVDSPKTRKLLAVLT